MRGFIIIKCSNGGATLVLLCLTKISSLFPQLDFSSSILKKKHEMMNRLYNWSEGPKENKIKQMHKTVSLVP
jgi:hypothetical protein